MINLQIMLKKRAEMQRRMQILRSGRAWLQQTSTAMLFSVFLQSRKVDPHFQGL